MREQENIELKTNFIEMKKIFSAIAIAEWGRAKNIDIAEN